MQDMGHGPLSILHERQLLTSQLSNSPYDCGCYLKRALCHELLGFPDLAVGDAYRALLLTDEVQDESGEYHDQAIEAIEKLQGSNGQHSQDGLQDGSNESHVITVAKKCAHNAFVVLIRSLSKCGCLQSAYNLANRGLKSFPDHQELQELQDQLVQKYCKNRLKHESEWDQSNLDIKSQLPEQGSVRRELYPWNDHEPDRFSESSISFLNREMQKIAPKCEILAVSLPLLLEHSSPDNFIGPSTPSPTIKQLGIFATEDIAPDEVVLHESSLLTANNRLYDPLCDACSAPLPPISSNQSLLLCCPSCDDTVFCSETCYNAAQARYHPAVCGRPDFDIVAKDPSPQAASNSLYLLLLARALALSFAQDIHPLDLPETKYIWGDFINADITYTHSTSASQYSIARHLPFTFHDNILAPLHLLEKMDMNTFTSLPRIDTWVINTLFAKFRATASARMSTRDGKPEVCAVHPLWCLANHSCAPNVRWEWGGEIKFEARNESDVAGWKHMGGKNEWGKGIKKGEEILNHYCDVELKVKERREWAAGALGGVCVCDRCVWEGKEESGEAE